MASRWTTQHERFCAEYVRCHDAKKSALAAGYAPTTALNKGAALMLREDILARIRELAEIIDREILIDAERILREAGRIALANVADLFDWPAKGTPTLRSKDAIPRDLQAAIKSIKIKPGNKKKGFPDQVEITMHDKMAAIHHLMEFKQLIGAHRVDGDGNQMAAKIELYMPERDAPPMLPPGFEEALLIEEAT